MTRHFPHLFLGALFLLLASGCAHPYCAVVRPSPPLSILSPELENLSDAKIETYLKAQARPTFPCPLAVAKVGIGSTYDYRRSTSVAVGSIEPLYGDEAEGWRKLVEVSDAKGSELIDQIQPINRLLVSEKVTLKGLRDAAALVHAPILLAYMQTEQQETGQNEAAMAYWTIIGLFIVPGHTVGYYSVCQGVLVDTRSGYILATVGGESKQEERVLPGAVEIAEDRTERKARAEAIQRLQGEVAETLKTLAGVPMK